MRSQSVLLVIGGGIAAYKSLELIRRLKERGIAARAILTKAGCEFVTPLSVSALTGGKASASCSANLLLPLRAPPVTMMILDIKKPPFQWRKAGQKSENYDSGFSPSTTEVPLKHSSWQVS